MGNGYGNTGGGANGPIPISRLAGTAPQLPASQGYFGTGGREFAPLPQQVFELPGMALFDAPVPGIGVQFAPGQGGDTPGGGGSYWGEPYGVDTDWIIDGYVNPSALQPRNRPGSVGFQGSRRSGA